MELWGVPINGFKKMGNWCYFTPFISGVISPPLITGDFGLTLDTPELLSALRFGLNPCANVACSSCAVGQFVAGDSLKGRGMDVGNV